MDYQSLEAMIVRVGRKPITVPLSQSLSDLRWRLVGTYPSISQRFGDSLFVFWDVGWLYMPTMGGYWRILELGHPTTGLRCQANTADAIWQNLNCLITDFGMLTGNSDNLEIDNGSPEHDW